MKQFLIENKRSLYGGLITAIIIGIGVFVLGNISGYEAKKLIENSLPGLNMLCNTIVLGSATILALLLTLLGISSSMKSKLKDQHYYFVLNIAKIDTILFVVAIIMFQLFNIPIIEADNVPPNWYKFIYWASLVISSLLSGFMVVVVLMLYNTVHNIILIVGLGKTDHPMLDMDDMDGEQNDME